jgi:hypothetical protein
MRPDLFIALVRDWVGCAFIRRGSDAVMRSLVPLRRSVTAAHPDLIVAPAFQIQSR